MSDFHKVGQRARRHRLLVAGLFSLGACLLAAGAGVVTSLRHHAVAWRAPSSVEQFGLVEDERCPECLEPFPVAVAGGDTRNEEVARVAPMHAWVSPEDRATISIGAARRNASAAVADATLFTVLGSEFLMGTGVASDDAQAGTNHVVIEERLWRALGSPSLAEANASVRVNGVPAVLTGVVRRGGGFPRQARIWMLGSRRATTMSMAASTPAASPCVALTAPLPSSASRGASTPATRSRSIAAPVLGANTASPASPPCANGTPATHAAGPRVADFVFLLTRMPASDAPGARARIRTVLDAQVRALGGARTKPARIGGVIPYALGLRSSRRLVGLLTGAVLLTSGAVFLNAFFLLTVEWQTQMGPIAIRIAMGAPPARALWATIRGSAFSAAAGTLAGGVGALWLVRHYREPMMAAFDVARVDIASWLPALLLVAVGTLLGVFVLIVSRAVNATPTGDLLRAGTVRSTRSMRQRRLLRVIVAGQMALSAMAASGALLMVLSLRNAQRITLGFEPRGVLVALASSDAVVLQGGQPGDVGVATPVEPALSAVRRALADPGAGNAAAAVWSEPLLRRARSENQLFAGTLVQRTEGQLLELLRIPLVNGRYFTTDELETGAPVALVNATLARRLWPGQDPVGKQIWYGMPPATDTAVTVIGTIDLRTVPQRDAMAILVDDPATPGPLVVLPGLGRSRSQYYVGVRRGRSTDEAQAANAVQEPQFRRLLAQSLPPSTLLYAGSMEAMLDVALRRLRAEAAWSTGLMVVMMLIAGIGLFVVGVMSGEDRRRELAIRACLGASPRRVMGVVAREVLVTAAWGAAIGIATGYAALYGLRAVLFDITEERPAGTLHGITVTSPTVYVLVALCIGLAGIVIGYMSARGSREIDLAENLRA